MTSNPRRFGSISAHLGARGLFRAGWSRSQARPSQHPALTYRGEQIALSWRRVCGLAAASDSLTSSPNAAHALLRDHAGGAHGRDGARAAPGLDAKHTARAAPLLRGLGLRLCAPWAADDAAAPGRAARRWHACNARRLLAGPRDQRLATPRAQGELQLLPSLQGATRPCHVPLLCACAMRLCLTPCAMYHAPCAMRLMACPCAPRYSPWCVRWRRWHRGPSSTMPSCSTTTRWPTRPTLALTLTLTLTLILTLRPDP